VSTEIVHRIAYDDKMGFGLRNKARAARPNLASSLYRRTDKCRERRQSTSTFAQSFNKNKNHLYKNCLVSETLRNVKIPASPSERAASRT